MRQIKEERGGGERERRLRRGWGRKKERERERERDETRSRWKKVKDDLKLFFLFQSFRNIKSLNH